MQALGLPPAAGHSHTFDATRSRWRSRSTSSQTRLLVPSEYSLGTFVDRGVPREKLVLHRYGYEAERFFASATAVVETPSPAPFTAIFVGRCEPRKGLHHALRAWMDSGAARPARFVICGSFEPGYRELLEPLLAHPSVEVHGFVSDPAALMRGERRLRLPVVEEGSALVTYEAQACGCVPSRLGGDGGPVPDGVDGFVHAPGDVATLTEQLRRLSVIPRSRAHPQRAAWSEASELSWAAAGEELAGSTRREPRRAP